MFLNSFIKRIKKTSSSHYQRLLNHKQVLLNATSNRFPSWSSLKPRRLRGKFTWRNIIRWGSLVAAAGILFAIILFAWYFKDLPKPGELRARSTEESTILYDRTGKQIYDISGDERRILLPSQEIPQNIKKATVAIEDKNFYNHHGLDFKGIIRGVLLKPFTGRGVQGGSTITQQYIKNAILSPKRSISRKIKELILALEIEAIYSKDDILTLYLNEIPYGSNIYGVEAASQAYYGKSAKDGLTISQAATLAAIPQAPTRYSPYGNHLDQLMTRKNIVIDAMVKNGSITQEEAEKAKKETPLESKDFAQRRDNFPAPHFVMYVREQLVAKYGEELVQRGGLRVTTSLDLDLQQKADDSVKEGSKTLDRAKASNASLVAIDPKSGQVLAMVGSVDYFDREHEGNFNVATAKRQPGSAIKPLVYATLFKEKWGPGSALWDVQTDFNGYKPNNFDGKFHGPLTVRKSLGNSFNIPAVKALGIVGINNFIDTATDAGITTFNKKADVGLSLALGAGEVKLVDLTAAYGVLANQGQREPLTSILKIQDSKGKVLDEWKSSPKQAIAPEIAYEISSILSDSEAKKPTFDRTLGVLTVSGKTVAVKTGTTNNYKDAWTVGYTPSLAAGVWAGNNDGTEMDHAGGSTAAAPIWHAFMVKALKDKGNEQFVRPSTVVDKTVDFLSGKNPTAASGQLVQDLFAPWQLPTKDDDVHILVKVCKSNGLLATDATPAEEIEQRSFTQVRSEQPNNPAWEGPVQAWARSSNLVSDPPTQKCDITTTQAKITITSPSNNETVDGIFTIAADVTWPPNGSGSVDFYVDGKFISSDDSDSYTATYDAKSLSNGTHTISATAKTSLNTTSTDTVTVTANADNTPPGDVSNVVIGPGTRGTANATWTNPSDSDLASISFYVSQASGVKGTRVGTINSTSPSSVQSTTITGIATGVTNYVTIVTTDKSNNDSPTTKQYTIVGI